jgi:hypothetical protein
MPCTRLRQKILQVLRKVLHQRRISAVHRNASSSSYSSSMECSWSSAAEDRIGNVDKTDLSGGSSSSSKDSCSYDDHSVDDTISHMIEESLTRIENTWCLNGRGKYRKRQYYDWDAALSNESTRYNDDEFLRIFQLHCESFHKLVNLIRHRSNFLSKPGKQ